MELNWLECIVYGLISGFTEFLPVSSLAHQTIFLKLLGRQNDALLQFCAYLGSFLALIIFSAPILLKLRRERRIAAMPKKKRRRQPDFATLMESRILRLTSITALVMFLAYSLVSSLHERLWVLAILVALNGVLLYVPQYLPSANKTAQSLSGLDALMIGLAAGAGMVPGISRVGAALSVAQIRGTDRRYCMDLAMLISVPALIVLMLISLLAALAGVAAVTGLLVLRCIIVTVSSFGSAYFAVFLMRFLSVKVGYGAFAYYCWGLALFALIIYLI